MIRRLRLSNFRRHEDTEVVFSPDHQLVLITGANGAGKSTLLEAITFALYGEGRHGRRHLEQLCRRGAELEGLEVECEFETGGDRWRVRRRRDSRQSRAILYANDVALVEGPIAVTDEITKLFGLDATGFRLAVVAQQKELDGLASLQPARRAEMISRLLRLDAIDAAAVEAGRRFRARRDTLKALGDAPDVARLRDQFAAVVREHDADVAAHEEARAELVALETELAASAGIEAAWHAAQRRVAHAEGRVSQTVGDVERLVVELDALEIPEPPPAPAAALAELEARAAELEREIAQAEAARQLAAQRRIVRTELARVETRMAELDALLAGCDVDAAELRVADAEAARAAAEAAVRAATEAVSTCEARRAVEHVALEHARDAVERVDGLGDRCEACGQPISADHRARRIAELARAVAERESRLDDLEKDLARARAELEVCRSQLSEAAEHHVAALRVLEETRAGAAELRELERRQRTYASQLAHIPDRSFDLETLYEQRGALAADIALARAAERVVRQREQALARRQTLRDALDAAQRRLEDARAQLAAAAVDADLEAAYRRREARVAARDDELALVREFETRVAVLAERRRALESEIARAEREVRTRAAVLAEAEICANAKTLLSGVSEELATRVRPELEGAVGELLARMSGGRFDAVRFDSDFAVSVRDDHEFRTLGELSGGEVDLVALATRLALAGVVAERGATAGPGFLVLDECFGSQDDVRRTLILTALRSLRDRYGQILLVSHVGGLEDHVDTVLEVTRDGRRSEVSGL